MKICICCSLTFTKEVFALADKLKELGYELLMPNGVVNRLIEQPDFDPVKAKTTTNAVRNHIDKVRKADAILVCNYDKKGISGYIGANTFIEIAAAHYHRKPIFALNPLPDQPYINDEIQSFGIKVLNGDLTRLEK